MAFKRDGEILNELALATSSPEDKREWIQELEQQIKTFIAKPTSVRTSFVLLNFAKQTETFDNYLLLRWLHSCMTKDQVMLLQLQLALGSYLKGIEREPS